MEGFISFFVLMLLLAFLCSVPYLIKRRKASKSINTKK